MRVPNDWPIASAKSASTGFRRRTSLGASDSRGRNSGPLLTPAHTWTPPWHYGPESAGAPAKTIDQIPLDSVCGQAVVLDVTDLSPGTEITPDHIDDRLDALDHDLEAGEIVLLETGDDDCGGRPTI